MKLRFAPYSLPLRSPLQTAHGAIARRDGFQIWIGAGRGEAAPLPAFGTESLAECEAALDAAGAALARAPAPETVYDVEALLDSLPRAARFGIELALLDDLARRREMPLARLLSNDAASEVPVCALLGAGEPASLAREARAAAQAGFRTVKLKVAQGALEDDLARTAVVRDAAGPSVRLRIDANAGWSEEQALSALRRLSPLGIELCEEPVGDANALRRLKGATGIPIGADESFANSSHREELFECADVVVLKPSLLGGLLPALRWARRARERGIQSLVTTALDGAIARAGAAHLAAAILGDGPALDAGLATGRLLAEDLCEDPAEPRDGRIRIGTAAGLGIA
jgi:o-succinylbenzoate synthase